MGQRHKVEPQRPRRGLDAQPGVGRAGSDGRGHGQVSILLALIAADGRRRNTPSPQLVIQQHPRARAALPINQLHVAPRCVVPAA